MRWYVVFECVTCSRTKQNKHTHNTATKTGGWASSKTEKGSLTKYARDVRHRITEKKRKKQSNRRRFRRKSKEQEAMSVEMKPRRDVKKCKDKVESWECEDVLHWLESTIGLPKYCDVFHNGERHVTRISHRSVRNLSRTCSFRWIQSMT